MFIIFKIFVYLKMILSDIYKEMNITYIVNTYFENTLLCYNRTLPTPKYVKP